MVRTRKTNKRAEGFTLLELLMVVIIIAILASLALPQYLRVVERTRAAEALTVIGAIRASQVRYAAQHPLGNTTDVMEEIDIDVPGFLNTAPSEMWDFLLDGGDAPINAGDSVEAVRNGGIAEVDSQNIRVFYENGVVCSDDVDAANIWGVPSC